MSSVRSNNLSLQYQNLTPRGCKYKDYKIRVCCKNQFLWQLVKKMFKIAKNAGTRRENLL